jgi:hypothetical protein
MPLPDFSEELDYLKNPLPNYSMIYFYLLKLPLIMHFPAFSNNSIFQLVKLKKIFAKEKPGRYSQNTG